METKNKPTQRSSKCADLKHDILGDGKPLTQPIAAGYIKNYLDGVHAKPGDDHNFGYLFGFDTITTFYNDIIAYNDNLGDDDLPVEGVRVYLGRHNPVDPNSPVLPGEKIMDTVFLIPVKSDGTDLPYVTPHIEGDTIILGEPRPCPNECLIYLSFLKDLKK